MAGVRIPAHRCPCRRRRGPTGSCGCRSAARSHRTGTPRGPTRRTLLCVKELHLTAGPHLSKDVLACVIIMHRRDVRLARAGRTPGHEGSITAHSAIGGRLGLQGTAGDAMGARPCGRPSCALEFVLSPSGAVRSEDHQSRPPARGGRWLETGDDERISMAIGHTSPCTAERKVRSNAGRIWGSQPA